MKLKEGLPKRQESVKGADHEKNNTAGDFTYNAADMGTVSGAVALGVLRCPSTLVDTTSGKVSGDLEVAEETG